MEGQTLCGDDMKKLSELMGLLKSLQFRLASAESCTGGLVSTYLTYVAGSSEVFLGGICSYSWDAKIKHLQVSEQLLQNGGSVQEQVAVQMAQGVRVMFAADIGLAVTGAAGPGVERTTDTVGDIWLAWDIKGCVSTKHLQISGDRHKIRAGAAIQIIAELCDLLKER
jgi:PncC family amidohydrolase